MKCEWIYDDDDYAPMWSSGCGKEFCFETEGPSENGFEFCPYCGKVLDQNPFSKQTLAERGPIPTIDEMCGLLSRT